jgi:ATP-dependent Clp protease ATP-binding subunit ClpX
MFQLRKLRCSFCGKKENEISKLVAGPRVYTGPRVYICDECAAVVSRILENAGDNQSQPPKVESSARPGLLTRVLRFLRGGDAHQASSITFSDLTS